MVGSSKFDSHDRGWDNCKHGMKQLVFVRSEEEGRVRVEVGG